MDLLKLNIFRAGLFKQAKFLFSTPQKSQKLMLVAEAGTLSQELLPVGTGFVKAQERKSSWKVLHNLKFWVYKNGVPAQDEQVLLISERTYMPLDPNGLIKSVDKESSTSLDDIAAARHATQMADVGKGEGQAHIAEVIVQGCFIIIAILAVVGLAAKSCGGP